MVAGDPSLNSLVVRKSRCAKMNNGSHDFGLENLNSKKGQKRSRKTYDKHECQQCGKTFLYFKNLQTHSQDFHNVQVSRPSYDCSDCGKKFKVESDLYAHRRFKHNGITKACHLCPPPESGTPKQYPLNLLSKHLHAVHFKKNPCTKCPIKFGNLGRLICHYRQSHLNYKQYRCKHCQRGIQWSFCRTIQKKNPLI